MNTDVVPPHNLEVEEALIALILADNSVIDRPGCRVDATDFYSDAHQVIYRAAWKCRESGEPFDAVTATDAIANHPDAISRVVGIMDVGYQRALMHNAPYYAATIRQKAADRRRISAARTAIEIQNNPSARDEDKSAAWAAVSDAAGVFEPDGTRLPIMLSDIWDGLDPCDRPPRRKFPVGAGFEDVDLEPGKIVVFGAPPGSGKTCLTMQWIIDGLLADPELTALVANCEMPAVDLMDRQISRLGDVPYHVIRDRPAMLGRIHGSPIAHAMELLGELKGRLGFARESYIIESIAEDAKRLNPDLIVLDYCQRIRPRDGSDNPRESIDTVMSHARRMADAGACVIAISAVGRQSGGGYKTGLSAFRESGDLEFSADDAWTVEIGEETEPGIKPATLHRVKARHGRLCDVSVEFDGNYMRFVPESVPVVQEGLL